MSWFRVLRIFILVGLFAGVSWAETKVTKVACIGDSITVGHGVREKAVNAYPALLGSWLGPKYQVKNFGVGGATMQKVSKLTYWKQKKFKQALAYEPDIVVIFLGTNDANLSNKNWKGAAVFSKDYMAMLDLFLALKSHPKIYLCYPVPAYPGDAGRRDKVMESEVLPAIKKVATKYHLPTIDLFTALSHHRAFFPDKLHPNGEGHKLIAKTIYQSLTGKWDWDLPADQSKFHIFFMMGQSNMEGHAKVLPQDRVPVPHIVMLRGKTGDIWLPAAHPLGNRNTFGLGLSFAKEYLKHHPGVTVGIVNCANGGVPIDRLKKGTNTYNDILRKIKIANHDGVITAALWHQGESDTISENFVNSYDQKLTQLITDFRADVGNPTLPFVIGDLAEFYGTSKDHNAPDRLKRINQIRRVLRSIKDHVKYVGFVESAGLKSSDQHMVHFDKASYVIFGKRYEQVLEKLLQK